MRTRFTGTNITVFLVFFGIALLEAIRNRSVSETLFWLLVGLLFLYVDFAGARRRPRE